MPKFRQNPHVTRNLFEISGAKVGDKLNRAGRKARKKHPVTQRARKAAFGETGQHIALKEPVQHQIDALPEIPCDATDSILALPPRQPATSQRLGDLGIQGVQVIPFHKKFLRRYPMGVYLNPGLLE